MAKSQGIVAVVFLSQAIIAENSEHIIFILDWIFIPKLESRKKPVRIKLRQIGAVLDRR